MLKFKTSCAVLAYVSSNLLNEVGLSLFRYFEVGLRVWDIVVKTFTFAISSPDEFLLLTALGSYTDAAECITQMFSDSCAVGWRCFCWTDVTSLAFSSFIPSYLTRIGCVTSVLCLTYRLRFILCLSPVVFILCITLFCNSCTNKRGHYSAWSYILQLNIGFTLRSVLAVFTRSAISPPKVNWFGWNLELLWLLSTLSGAGSGRFRARSTHWGQLESQAKFCFFYQVSNARFHHFNFFFRKEVWKFYLKGSLFQKRKNFRNYNLIILDI